MKKRQRTKWLMTHRYPNGMTRAGIIYNNPIKCDVIAFESTYNDFKKGKVILGQRQMSIDEALVQIEVLSRAVSYYVEHHRKIPQKNG